MATISISIFVVSYNTRDLLEQCLKSIFENSGDLAVEVFVADNNSADGSPEMIRERFPQVFLERHSQNIGYTRAINQLLPLGKAEYCLLLHPDLEILPNTFKEFMGFFELHPQAGILGGNLYYPDGTPNPCEIMFPNFGNDLVCFALRLFKRVPGGRQLIGDHNPSEWSHQSTSRVNWVWNACMMVRKGVFERIGYFDENFYVWYADWDLCKRAADNGWGVYYLHSAVAVHHERRSYGKGDVSRKEIRYKVDGWYSAASQIQDRYVFLRKHTSRLSTSGVKVINVADNTLRLLIILVNLLLGRAVKDISFQARACLNVVHTVLKA